MIEKLRKKEFFSLLDFVRHNHDSDFYYTENNQRIFLDNFSNVKACLHQSSLAFRSIAENGDIDGVNIIWKSRGNNISRNYLKVNAVSSTVARKILKVILWNFTGDLFAKINKKSKFLPVLMSCGFKFFGDRGKEILVKREQIVYKVRVSKDEE